MTRRRIKHELIENESKRNTVLLKRTDSLVKKADELSVLCGVHVAIVVHKRRQRGRGGSDQEDNAVLWPSPSAFRERLHRFLDCTNFERNRRMTVHEKYMDQRIDEERESISKLKKRIEIQESHQLMMNMHKNKSLDKLIGLNELEGLISVADEMLRKLEMKEQLLCIMEPPPPLGIPPLPPRPSQPFFSSRGGRRREQIIGGGGDEASRRELHLSEEQAPPPPDNRRGVNVAAHLNQESAPDPATS